MVFSSTVFVFLFRPLVLALNFAVRTEIRNAALVLASLVFYAWGAARYVPLLIGPPAAPARDPARHPDPGLRAGLTRLASLTTLSRQAGEGHVGLSA
jgi:hypothetical protein